MTPESYSLIHQSKDITVENFLSAGSMIVLHVPDLR